MSDGCRAFERRHAEAEPADAASRAAWADHLRACTSCREQDVADRALRAALASDRPPVLPPFFAERCASRARLVPSARPLGGRSRVVLRAYWVLAAVLGGLVLARIDWPTAIPDAVATGAVVTLAVVLSPVLLLAHLRGGLFQLVRRMLG
jgi:hypothetical protein